MRQGLLALLAISAALLPMATSARVPKLRTHTTHDGTVYTWDADERRWILHASPAASADDGPMLALKGRRFDIDFAAGQFVVGGRPLIVKPAASKRESEEQQDGDTGRVVWDGAIVLAKYLERERTSVRGRRGRFALRCVRISLSAKDVEGRAAGCLLLGCTYECSSKHVECLHCLVPIRAIFPNRADHGGDSRSLEHAANSRTDWTGPQRKKVPAT